MCIRDRGKPLGRKQNIGIESRKTMAKILAVDDEPAILEMIESILNKDGHLVTLSLIHI